MRRFRQGPFPPPNTSVPHPEPRRIAVLGPFPPLRGGIAQFDARILHALRARGHDLSAVSFSRLYPGILFPGRSQREPVESSLGEGAEVVDSVNPLSWLRAARMIRETAPDVLITAYWSPALAPALGTANRHSGAPTIAVVHNASPHESIPFGRMLTKWFLRSCRGVLALSDAVADDVRRLGFDGPIAVTPHPAYDAPDRLPSVAASRAALGLPPTGPVLLFFGLVRAYKGVDILIEAMPKILAARPDATLLVAGEWYADASPTRKRIGELNLGDRVRIDDRYLPSSEFGNIFGAADIVVQPYRSATQSGVLQLAASHGVPCVVTDVGGLADPVRKHEAGIVVPPGDPGALAAGVLEALEPDRLGMLGRGAYRMVDAHGWDSFCEALESLINRTTT